MTLDKLQRTTDIKNISPEGLIELAEDIRRFIVHSLSDTGGHLSSNLGVVELTIALHGVFQTPQDKIVWDVGHQSYIHKILTGRKDRFASLRQLDGLSGFPKRSESVHDAFGTGHSSTAISAALGLAEARDLVGRINRQKPIGKVVAVVGDGSMTGGLAFEGLNNAGRSSTDLLVVLNDNQMSISRNVGAISRHFNQLRTASGYLDAKADVHQLLKQFPVVGKPVAKAIESVKDSVKRVILPGVLFEELGFRYFGPVDGHDTPALMAMLKSVKDIKGPVLLHVLTTKGKGYNRAERAPNHFHGVGTFCVDTGKPAVKSDAQPTLPTYTEIFAKHLCNRAMTDKCITAVTAAMLDGTGLSEFKKRFPKRFFDVGIAEGHAVTFAAGLAAGGLKPVVAIYSSFMQRAYDNIIHDVAVQNLPVIFALDRAGAVGGDGETHQGLYDMAYLSHIPNLTMLAPMNGSELHAMLDFALAHNGPTAIRYPKDTPLPGMEALPQTEIQYGKSDCIEKGAEIAIVSVGAMMATAKAVSAQLKALGHSPSLYNARFIKPIDADLIKQLKTYRHIFTIEDGIETGGFGAQVKQILPNSHIFAFPDRFIETGTRAQLFERYHLHPEGIMTIIQQKMQSETEKSHT